MVTQKLFTYKNNRVLNRTIYSERKPNLQQTKRKKNAVRHIAAWCKEMVHFIFRIFTLPVFMRCGTASFSADVYFRACVYSCECVSMCSSADPLPQLDAMCVEDGWTPSQHAHTRTPTEYWQIHPETSVHTIWKTRTRIAHCGGGIKRGAAQDDDVATTGWAGCLAGDRTPSARVRIETTLAACEHLIFICLRARARAAHANHYHL